MKLSPPVIMLSKSVGWSAICALGRASFQGLLVKVLYLQRPFQLCEGLLLLLLRCTCGCASLAPAWMLTGLGLHTVWLRGLFRRCWPPTSQSIREEARIEEELQHALLCNCPVQWASKLQRLSASTLNA